MRWVAEFRMLFALPDGTHDELWLADPTKFLNANAGVVYSQALMSRHECFIGYRVRGV